MCIFNIELDYNMPYLFLIPILYIFNRDNITYLYTFIVQRQRLLIKVRYWFMVNIYCTVYVSIHTTRYVQMQNYVWSMGEKRLLLFCAQVHCYIL